MNREISKILVNNEIKEKSRLMVQILLPLVPFGMAIGGTGENIIGIPEKTFKTILLLIGTGISIVEVIELLQLLKLLSISHKLNADKNSYVEGDWQNFNSLSENPKKLIELYKVKVISEKKSK